MLYVHICKHRLYISQFKNICKFQIVPVIGLFTCNNCINIIKKSVWRKISNSTWFYIVIKSVIYPKVCVYIYIEFKTALVRCFRFQTLNKWNRNMTGFFKNALFHFNKVHHIDKSFGFFRRAEPKGSVLGTQNTGTMAIWTQ